jgi:hypothetical protein
MRQYEPYRQETEEEPRAAAKEGPAPPDRPPKLRGCAALLHQRSDGSARTTQDEKVEPPPDAGRAPAGLGLPDGGVDDSDKPWWQRHDADKRLHEVKLDELQADADAILAKRMVKGFYVAVDREFNWNGRPWYKTTKGLVAPADRFWVTNGSEFHGVELDGEHVSLRVSLTAEKRRPNSEMDAPAARWRSSPDDGAANGKEGDWR